MSLHLRTETTVYDRYAISRKFLAQQTEINIVQGKISLIASESQINELKNGNKTMYSRLATVEVDLNNITLAVSSSEYKTINGVLSAVTQARASIAINTQQIALKVSKGNVSSQLSVETGQVAISSNRLVVSATNLSISADGTLNAKNGIFSGTVNASLGTIGGWNITATDVYDNSAASACAGIGKNGSTFAFWAGSTFANRNNAPFRVGHDGSLYAENATIRGNVTASSGTFGGRIIAQSFRLDRGAYFHLECGGSISIGDQSAVHTSISAGFLYLQNETTGATISMSLVSGDPHISVRGSGTGSYIAHRYISTPQLIQTSLATEKTKIRKYESTALSRVMSCDVYQYNLKCDMEHENIGFVIGDGFQVDESIINRDVGGVNIYSAVALAYKAIQELVENELAQNSEMCKLLQRVEQVRARL